MERGVKEYLSTSSSFYQSPYMNHRGDGSSIGGGDEYGNGRAFVSVKTNDDYKGSSIISYNDHDVYFVNGYVLYITNIHEPWANAEIIKNDLTTQSCYIGKINNNVIVGSTLKEVFNELKQRIKKSNDNEQDVAQAFFISHPDYNKEYNWDEMVFWHSLINTSCSDGRRNFTHKFNKNSSSVATPKELIEFMKSGSTKSLALKMEELYLNNDGNNK